MLSTIPAIGNCLIGLLSGELLRESPCRAATKSSAARAGRRGRSGRGARVGHLVADQQKDVDFVIAPRCRGL